MHLSALSRWRGALLHVQIVGRMIALLLRHDLPGVKLHKHGTVRLQLLHGYRKPKVVQ